MLQFAEDTLTLRDYQERTVQMHLDAMELGIHSILSGIFTGAGKTVIFVELARRCDGRTLIICPMRELVWQAVDKVNTLTSSTADIEMADYVADREWPAKITVASKQSLLSRRGGELRYKSFDGFRLVIVDEAHTMCSEAVVQMLQYFVDGGAMVAGFTATPFRTDGTPMMAEGVV
jgi:superfamily II DNA or RNA helicase